MYPCRARQHHRIALFGLDAFARRFWKGGRRDDFHLDSLPRKVSIKNETAWSRLICDV
jgi:hypothetical protein